MTARLYYIHDPMCSWCWGFRPTWDKVKVLLAEQGITTVNLLGGLAPDTDQPMPIELQQQIQAHWYRINEQLGTEFNFDFWLTNTPRRSTYPACRAVLAARLLDQKYQISHSHGLASSLEDRMIDSIQRGYYLRALNPSENSILVLLFDELIHTLGLSDEYIKLFVEIFRDHSTHVKLLEEIAMSRKLTSSGFPSLVFNPDSKYYAIPLDYSDPNVMLEHINACFAI